MSQLSMKSVPQNDLLAALTTTQDLIKKQNRELEAVMRTPTSMMGTGLATALETQAKINQILIHMLLIVHSHLTQEP